MLLKLNMCPKHYEAATSILHDELMMELDCISLYIK